MREWETGKVQKVYKMDKYEEEWGNHYYMFHRQDMHATLLKTATAKEGKGTPCKIVIDHMFVSLLNDRGRLLTFGAAASVSMRKREL
jgi:salicylate hydroxylase